MDKYGVPLALAVLLLCVSVAILANSCSEEGSSPEQGASAEGVWHQTMTRGYYDGAKTASTFESNDLTIREYTDYDDPKHFLKCSQRGSDFVAVRYGDRIIWNYETNYGMYLAISTCYGECIVVNEIFQTYNSTVQTYVSSSVYTKDDVVPSWLNNWDYEALDQKWILRDAQAISSSTSVALNGKNLYLLENYGPIFKAEMEQSVGTTISTKGLIGTILEYDQSGYMLAIVLDDTEMMWMMCLTGNTVSLSTVAHSDYSEIEGEISVLRRYVGIYDASLPILDQPAFTDGTRLDLEDAKYFRLNGVRPLLVEGRAIVERVYVSAFYCSGVFSDTRVEDRLSILGYSVPTTDDSEYFLYCECIGALGEFEYLYGGGFGYYDRATGLFTYSFLIPDAYDPRILEMTFKVTPANR